CRWPPRRKRFRKSRRKPPRKSRWSPPPTKTRSRCCRRRCRSWRRPGRSRTRTTPARPGAPERPHPARLQRVGGIRQTVLRGQPRQRDRVADAQLVVEPLLVRGHGLPAQAERRADLLHALAGAEQARDFQLARRQLVEG